MKSLLQEILENEYDIRSYSGRGMYGRKCLGLELDGMSQIGELISVLIEAAIDTRDSSLAREVRGLEIDSMGRGIIVYFPKIEYVK